MPEGAAVVAAQRAGGLREHDVHVCADILSVGAGIDVGARAVQVIVTGSVVDEAGRPGRDGRKEISGRVVLRAAAGEHVSR